jgi:hypothetical protein
MNYLEFTLDTNWQPYFYANLSLKYRQPVNTDHLARVCWYGDQFVEMSVGYDGIKDVRNKPTVKMILNYLRSKFSSRLDMLQKCQDQLQKPKIVDLSSWDARSVSFETFKYIPEIETLSIKDSIQVSNTDLSLLSCCSSVKNFHLCNCPAITPSGTVNIVCMPNLERLSLIGNLLSDEILEEDDWFEGFPNLKTLVISGSNLTAKGLSTLKSLTGLTELRLNGVSLNEEILDMISSFTNLEILDFGHSSLPKDGIKKLESLQKLKTVLLYGVHSADNESVSFLLDRISTIRCIHAMDTPVFLRTDKVISSSCHNGRKG